LLSYRHSFHAGNVADVLKHIILVEVLDHLTQKHGGFDYIDTHSGAGIFHLQSEHAKKLQEHTAGIGQLKPEQWPELARYFEVVNAYNHTDVLDRYPGSPAIAAHFLRPQDRAWLYELHPKDYERLYKTMQKYKKVRVTNSDGLQAMSALLPPVSRRALVLVDPSYEVKSEYDHVSAALINAHKKFSTGVFALWYPVVERERIQRLERQLVRSGIRNIQRFELGVRPDSDARGMTASGMFVINPPWTLHKKMSQWLPKLASTLGHADSGHFKCDIITGE